jgi:hypothetical protein
MPEVLSAFEVYSRQFWSDNQKVVGIESGGTFQNLELAALRLS